MALEAADGGREAEVVLGRLSGLRGPATPRGARAMPRLVVISSGADQDDDDAHALVDLAHEALLRNDRQGKPYWKTLRDWVDQYRKQLEDRRLLEILAEKWQDRGRPRLGDALARGGQLRDFRRVGTAISKRAADYLGSSRRRQWLRAGGLGALTVLVVALGGAVAWMFEQGTTPGEVWQQAMFRAKAEWNVFGAKVGWLAPALPEMVLLNGDRFLMGSDDGDEDERPPHWVTVPAFEIGRHEVTFDQWDFCVADGGCNAYWPDDQDWGRGPLPAINVTWADARAYVEWLSGTTNQEYRLPSEAEWEYAARAGSDTAYWWGDDQPTPDQANFDGNVGRTTEAGAYPANPWGLRDMNGNVWEWVEDCWSDNYEAAREDGRPWTDGDCGRRVLRGGSWSYIPAVLRSAVRFGFGTGDRYYDVGFRVARTLSRSESITP
jgi:formylglycine-generating enzyme required for sulfatase activity